MAEISIPKCWKNSAAGPKVRTLPILFLLEVQRARKRLALRFNSWHALLLLAIHIHEINDASAVAAGASLWGGAVKYCSVSALGPLRAGGRMSATRCKIEAMEDSALTPLIHLPQGSPPGRTAALRNAVYVAIRTNGDTPNRNKSKLAWTKVQQHSECAHVAYLEQHPAIARASCLGRSMSKRTFGPFICKGCALRIGKSTGQNAPRPIA